MKIVVIDGQGGRIGKALIEGILSCGIEAELVAIGTNAMATAQMIKAGAALAATGENPVIVSSRDADIIVGPIGIVAANSLLGEVTPAMAAAVSESPAVKLLIPLNKCNLNVVGTMRLTVAEYIEQVIEAIRNYVK